MRTDHMQIWECNMADGNKILRRENTRPIKVQNLASWIENGGCLYSHFSFICQRTKSARIKLTCARKAVIIFHQETENLSDRQPMPSDQLPLATGKTSRPRTHIFNIWYQRITYKFSIVPYRRSRAC